ncbi:hypothetical protein PspLS_10744 [Pyricularia sp. CBS 133598]|nr:hypothetical protein PspLS_10744 [Pyricularia sp. CBS 133598]
MDTTKASSSLRIFQIIGVSNHQKSPILIPGFPQIVFKAVEHLRVHLLTMQDVVITLLSRPNFAFQPAALRTSKGKVPRDLLVLLRRGLEMFKRGHPPGQGRGLALYEELRLGLGPLPVGAERSFEALESRDDALDIG